MKYKFKKKDEVIVKNNSQICSTFYDFEVTYGLKYPSKYSSSYIPKNNSKAIIEKYIKHNGYKENFYLILVDDYHVVISEEGLKKIGDDECS